MYKLFRKMLINSSLFSTTYYGFERYIFTFTLISNNSQNAVISDEPFVFKFDLTILINLIDIHFVNKEEIIFEALINCNNQRDIEIVKKKEKCIPS